MKAEREHGATKKQIMKRNADNTKTEMVLPPGEVRVSVRNFVEFLLRRGDIDNRRQSFSENAMQEGSRIHRMLQRKMVGDYRAEVALRYTYPAGEYVLVVEGRADGVIDGDKETLIDEIKGTYRDLHKIQNPVPIHMAQAKCYAYIYALQREKKEIRVRLTYCNMETEDIRYFFKDYTFRELEEWFHGMIKEYRKWSDYAWEWRRTRQQSIEGLAFPYPYREGQRELAAHVYSTIYHGKKLFLEAPTGVGKTLSTVFPSIAAMGKGLGEKLFYLTAKTITGTVAEETFALLRGRGLRFKSIMLTAKEKLCFLEEAQCNPDACPYAKGHYDRINAAVFELLTTEESFTREKLEEYAQKHRVCPFELCLDMSLFADGIICDYNYVFDPHVYLKRFFGESSKAGTGNAQGSYIFLIDEAHNLLERGREMYSAALLKEDFLELKREIKQTIMSEISEKVDKNNVSGQLTLEMTSMSDEPAQPPMRTGKKSSGKRRAGGKSILVRQGYAERLEYHLEKCNRELLALKRECDGYRLVESIEPFVQTLQRLHCAMSEYLEEQEEELPAVKDMLLDFYFAVSHFLEIYDGLDEHYVKYTQMGEDGAFLLKLFCVHPGKKLRECMLRGRSTVLFSATFLPIQYYKRLLGGEAQDYEVYAKSIFNPEKRALLIAGDVTSRYARRSDEEFSKIAAYIHEVVKNRHGNYMVFFPSYSFQRAIYDIYTERFDGGEEDCILQGDSMKEEEREAFLARFRQEAAGERSLLGFCVLGGVFSEGIDLKNDSLIGVIVVGTGLPQVCDEREILKNYFEEGGENGFDFSYRYPGMNKVLQAAGRVIRTATDVGIIVLLDERFQQPAYRRLFPREWEYYEGVTLDTVAKRVERFWDSWL